MKRHAISLTFALLLVAQACVAAAASEREVAPATGICLYSSAGVMERTAEINNLDDRGGIVGFAATLECEHHGELVRINGSGPFKVVDCAMERDRPRLAVLTSRLVPDVVGFVAEVDRETARRWRMRGPIKCSIEPFEVRHREPE